MFRAALLLTRARAEVMIVLLAARWLLTSVFWSSAMAKRADPAGTLIAARNYGLPPSTATLVARWLPLVELVLAVGLAVGVALPAVGCASAALLVAFATAIAFALARGRRFSCGCGSQPHDISSLLVLRNLSLAGLACAVAWVPPAALAAWPWLVRPAHGQPVLDLLPVPGAMLALCLAVRCVRVAWPLRVTR